VDRLRSTSLTSAWSQSRQPNKAEQTLSAITQELHKQEQLTEASRRKYLKILVGRAGLEPATNGLKVRCSTN
jgi:hypothetical protein